MFFSMHREPCTVNRYFIFTIDVEDWFQVENLRPWNPIADWDSRELRVERNVHRLLDLFDSFTPHPAPCTVHRAPSYSKDNPVGSSFVPEPCTVRRAPIIESSEKSTFHHRPSTWGPVDPVNPVEPSFSRAPRTVHPVPFIHTTFFVLGWLAERLPHLVREIAARGHEVASHGSSHRMCRPLSDEELRNELGDSKRLLEDITGAEVAGFRAPNFSVDDRVLDLVRECGYQYDSSYNSFSLHGRYGKITLNGQPRAGIAYELSDSFFELPVSNLNMENLIGARCTVHGTRKNSRYVLPWSGGAYFRLMPLGVFQRGVRAILDRDGAYVFYMHPWEIDAEQPRVGQASPAARFKHYTNLEKTMAKLRGMMDTFTDCRFVGCGEYIRTVRGARCRVHGEGKKESA
jgi:polysaccharide deacetylase family protein (PEP-CTERM system associated)